VSQLLLIINADDLGISQQVNEAVFDLMAERRISSATLMANAPAVRHAAAQIQHFSNCSFGVHLNLTQFAPVTGGHASQLIVDGTGQFSRAIETASPRLARLRAIYEEWCAQIDLLISLGVPISHFDSHHHVHTTPYLFPVLKAVQKRYRVDKVRISKNLYQSEQPCPRGLYRKKQFYNWALRHIYPTCTTDAFTEMLSFYRESCRRTLLYRSIELMVHPGASYAAEETSVLKTDWLIDIGFPVEMIHYGQLAAARVKSL
jgi:predicted glycoside hydrolase/deacetylase ChbG (UPF0249 family)